MVLPDFEKRIQETHEAFSKGGLCDNEIRTLHRDIFNETQERGGIKGVKENLPPGIVLQLKKIISAFCQ